MDRLKSTHFTQMLRLWICSILGFVLWKVEFPKEGQPRIKVSKVGITVSFLNVILLLAATYFDQFTSTRPASSTNQAVVWLQEASRFTLFCILPLLILVSVWFQSIKYKKMLTILLQVRATALSSNFNVEWTSMRYIFEIYGVLTIYLGYFLEVVHRVRNAQGFLYGTNSDDLGAVAIVYIFNAFRCGFIFNLSTTLAHVGLRFQMVQRQLAGLRAARSGSH